MKRTVLMFCAALAVTACSRGEDFAGLGTGGPTGTIDPSAAEALAALDGRGIPVESPRFFYEIIGDRIFFAVDQSTLSPEAQGTLDLQAAWLAQRSGPITIEGHADEQGTTDYNIALSNRRAAAVRDYLVTKGIPDQRLSINGFGKARPVAVCSDESCWSQNRRSVTVFSEVPGV